MGQLFHGMGFLQSTDVVEVSAADLIGQHVGHTIPKTRNELQRGIGKVLVVDGIHRLAKGGYTAEALDELVYFVQEHSRRMVVVLTGQTQAIDGLMRDRRDLAALFPNEIVFNNIDARECLALLDQELQRDGVQSPFFASEETEKRFHKAVGLLSAFPCWSNAKDVQQLACRMLQMIPDEIWSKSSQDEPRIPEGIAMECIREMFQTKRSRARKYVDTDINPQQSAKPKQAGSPGCDPTVSQVAHEATADKRHESNHQDTYQQQHKAKDKSRSVQEVLRGMAPCQEGYDWVREGNGYRCKGGSHVISDAEIEGKL